MADRNDQRKKLRDIHWMLYVSKDPFMGRSPRGSRGVVATGASLLICSLPFAWGGPAESDWIVAALLAIPCVAVSIGWVLRAAKSWEQALYDLLAQYEPTDKASFDDLLVRIKDGRLNRDGLIEWVLAETRANDLELQASRKSLLSSHKAD